MEPSTYYTSPSQDAKAKIVLLSSTALTIAGWMTLGTFPHLWDLSFCIHKMKLISTSLSPSKFSVLSSQISKCEQTQRLMGGQTLLSPHGPKSSVKTCSQRWWSPREKITTIEYRGRGTHHLVPQEEFKSVSHHNHKGEGLAGSPVV